MFKQRLLSGIILVLVAIGAIYFGGYVLWGVLLLISLIQDSALSAMAW